MWQQLKTLFQQKAKRMYCAMVEIPEGYFLAAIEKTDNKILFQTFFTGSALEILERFYDYGLVSGLPMEACMRKTYFLPKEMTWHDIYQQLKTQEKNLNNAASFDFEILETQEHPDEYLVIAYFVKKTSLIEIQQLGFKLAAIEPLELAQKREIDKAWQHKALEKFYQTCPLKNKTYAETILKLLDRDNFYDA